MLRSVSVPTPKGGRIEIGLPDRTGAFRTNFKVYQPGHDKPRLDVDADAAIGGFGCLTATGKDRVTGDRFSLAGVFPQIGLESYDLGTPECLSVRRDRLFLPDTAVAETEPGFLANNGLVGLQGYALQCGLPVAAGLLVGSAAAFLTGHTGWGVAALVAAVPCALGAASRPVPL